MMYLDADTLARAAAIGNGNVSRGVRIALAASTVKKTKV
jgi:hypothetical protein